jgi:S-adenosylmethionine/arginine decarboxylase-like enzyme
VDTVQLGWHWIFDGWVDRIACDEQLLVRILDEVPARLGLTRVSPPQVFAQEAASVAGIVLLAESHFSLHVFPARGLLHGDLFSCKAFEVSIARRCLEEFFAFRQLSEQVLDRGAERGG